MTRTLAFLFLSSWASAVTTLADDLPGRLNFDRYQTLVQRSPFTVATAVAPPSATPNFAKDLYVANAAKSLDAVMVTIASSSDRNFKKYLSPKTAVDGYTIAKIHWSNKVGQTKVTISKDGELATLNFNQMIVAQPLPNPAAAPPNGPGSIKPPGSPPSR